jgi:excisionase family DNA binding protein
MANLFDKRQAGAALGISTVSIDRLRRSGKLPYRKFGGLIRFTEQDIQDFIEQSSVKTESPQPPVGVTK